MALSHAGGPPVRVGPAPRLRLFLGAEKGRQTRAHLSRSRRRHGRECRTAYLVVVVGEVVDVVDTEVVVLSIVVVIVSGAAFAVGAVDIVVLLVPPSASRGRPIG